MNYMTAIENQTDDELDIFINKNLKFVFYHFNHYLAEIGQPLKFVRHSVISDDNYALTARQERRWQYFVERLLEQNFQVTEAGEIMLADGTPQENATVSDSIRNVTVCKDVYNNMYGAVADCLREAFSYMDQESIGRIEKDLRLNYFFINFNHKNNAQNLIKAYAHFFNELGRFPGSLDLAVIPQGSIPNFIQTTDIISLSNLYSKFKSSDVRGLVSVRFLASFHA